MGGRENRVADVQPAARDAADPGHRPSRSWAASRSGPASRGREREQDRQKRRHVGACSDRIDRHMRAGRTAMPSGRWQRRPRAPPAAEAVATPTPARPRRRCRRCPASLAAVPADDDARTSSDRRRGHVRAAQVAGRARRHGDHPFTDIEGSTGMTEALGDQPLDRGPAPPQRDRAPVRHRPRRHRDQVAGRRLHDRLRQRPPGPAVRHRHPAGARGLPQDHPDEPTAGAHRACTPAR